MLRLIGRSKTVIFGYLLNLLLITSASSAPNEKGVYQLTDGKLLSPTAMELQGSERRVTISSPIGPMELRWQRDVEVFFGRTPERALIEAARSISRALNKGGFPVRVTSLNMRWNIIFFGENLPGGQVPAAILSGCHPGWMIGNREEANIYIRAQAVVAGCGGNTKPKSSVADEKLSQVIVHEIGHGIEGALLQGKGSSEKLRSEGFATWFEQYVSEFSPVLRSAGIQAYYKKLALYRMKTSPGPFVFQGTAYDYAYSSMYFVTLEERFGVRGLFSVYDLLLQGSPSFYEAIFQRFKWSRSKLEEEVSRILK